jgi:hypothetical protein
MRLTIIRDDNLIIKDGIGYNADLTVFDDLSWIDGYDQKSWGKFHALQWYGDPDEDGEYGFGKDEPHGELEFKKTVPNLIIKELGVFDQALALWETAKVAEETRIALEESEMQRLEEERLSYLQEFSNYDLEQLLNDL